MEKNGALIMKKKEKGGRWRGEEIREMFGREERRKKMI